MEGIGVQKKSVEGSEGMLEEVKKEIKNERRPRKDRGLT